MRFENHLLTEGIKAYHGTDSKIRKFNTFSHFGTLKAAQDRLNSPIIKKRAGLHIYSVNLDIKKPLRVDDANVDDASKVAQSARMAGALDWNDVMEIWGIEDEDDATVAVIEKLKKKGYDGLVYKNKVEDAGNDSYIIFSPKQVKNIKVMK